MRTQWNRPGLLAGRRNVSASYVRCGANRVRSGGRRWIGGNANRSSEAVFTIINIADGPRTHRTERFATVATVADSVRIRMDGTLHRILLSMKSGKSAASICKFLSMPLARFCCFGDEGLVPSVWPGSLGGGC